MGTSERAEWLTDLKIGLIAYYLTSLPVLLGLLFGIDFLRMRGGDNATPRPDFLTAVTRFDALNYARIVHEGYSYDPARRSRVAFFPAFPSLSLGLQRITGWQPETAMLVTANLALAAAFVLLAAYVRLRWPESLMDQRVLVLTVFGLWPASLFFRLAYAESVFLCGTLAVLYGMARGWQLLPLALLTGFVTATRPVGVALTAAFAWYVLSQPGITRASRIARLIALTPVACWGLIAYMVYQAFAFGNPVAFAQTQEHWTMVPPHESGWPAKLWSLLTLEPVWGVYVPDSARYWANGEESGNPFLSMTFWNPILFVGAFVLLLLGACKRWLVGAEVVLGSLLLIIPYLTRSDEMSMYSHGRFAAAVVVNYLVIGRLLDRAPVVVAGATCAACSLLLFTWGALFAAGYRVF